MTAVKLLSCRPWQMETHPWGEWQATRGGTTNKREGMEELIREREV